MVKTKKRFVAASLAALMMCSAFVAPVKTTSNSTLSNVSIVRTVEASAEYVTRGCFNGSWYSGWVYLYPENSRKSSKIKVCAFMQNGKIKSGKFKVQVYSGNGNYVGTYSVSGSGYITLNSGYNSYKIRFIRNGNSSTNVSRTQYWSVDRYKNLSWF